MKKNSFLIVIVLICAVCILTGCFNGLFNFKISSYGTYKDANKYSIGSFSYNASGLDKVCIDYVSGDVTLVQSANRTLSVTENDSRLSDDQKVHWYLDGKTLYIRFCKSGYSGKFPNNSKKISIEIPFDIELEVGITSGDVTFATDVEARNVSLGATSGDFKVRTVRTGEFQMGSTSGSVSMDALYATKVSFGSTSGNTSVDLIHAEAIKFGATSGNTVLGNIYASDVNGAGTSGNIILSFEYCENLSIGCTSGNIRIEKIPSNGATIKYEKTSGTLKADGYMVKDNRMVFGAGGCKMEIVTTSGDLIISN